VVGAVVGWIYEKIVSRDRQGEVAKRLGVLIASGFIVGESLFNVALAGLIVLSGEGEPLAITSAVGEHAGMVVALVLGAALVTGLYRWSSSNAKRVFV